MSLIKFSRIKGGSSRSSSAFAAFGSDSAIDDAAEPRKNGLSPTLRATGLPNSPAPEWSNNFRSASFRFNGFFCQNMRINTVRISPAIVRKDLNCRRPSRSANDSEDDVLHAPYHADGQAIECSYNWAGRLAE